MAGIDRLIQSRKEEETNRETSNQFRLLLRLKDGDNAYLSIVPTGKEDDNRFDGEIFVHSETIPGGEKFRATNSVCEKSTTKQNCQYCEKKIPASRQFAFWAYVGYILHPTKRADSWEEYKMPSGQLMYKETVNDFKIFSRGPGRSRYLENQLIDIYTERGSLDGTSVRVRRTGIGRDDTAYDIKDTGKPAKLTGDLLEKAKKLPAVRKALIEVFSKPIVKEEPIKLDEEKSSLTEEDLMQDLIPLEEEEESPF